MSRDQAVSQAELSLAIVFVHVDAGYQQGRPGHCAVENLKHQKVKIRSESEKVKREKSKNGNVCWVDRGTALLRTNKMRK